MLFFTAIALVTCQVQYVRALSQNDFLIAATEGNLEMVALGIRQKDLDISMRYAEEPAIHAAAFNGHTSVVEALLNAGVEFTLKNMNNTGPIFSAIVGDQSEVIEFLHRRGADVNGHTFYDDIVFPYIVTAAEKGCVNSVRTLVRLGSDINARTAVRPGASVSKDVGGESPLLAAAFEGKTDVIKLLLELGADVSIVNNQGNTALHAAAFKGRHLTAQVLINSNKFNISAVNKNGFNPVMFAGSADSQNPKLMRMLLKAGASPIVPNGVDFNPLILAVRTMNKVMLQELYNWKIDVNAYDSVNFTALYHALTNNQLKVVSQLLRRGGELGHQNEFVKGIKDEWTRHVITCDWFYGILVTNNLSTTQVSGPTYPYLDYCDHIKHLKAHKCIVKLLDQANLYGYDGLVNRLNFKSFTDSVNGNFDGVKKAKERAFRDIKHLHKIEYRNKYEEDIEEQNEQLPNLLHKFSEQVEPPRPADEKMPSLSEILNAEETVRQVHRPPPEERPHHARKAKSLKGDL